MGSSTSAGPAGAELHGDARVLVIDHRDSYTWNLVHLVAAVTGVLPDVLPNGGSRSAESVLRAGGSGDFTHIVLSPGPGHPDEYDWSVLDVGLPVLGVCLGMQGIVRHFGGEVGRVRPAHGEVAAIDHDGSGLFAGVPSPLRAVRYHSLAATLVPSGLEVTARSTDDVVQALRHRDLPIVGVQFHPESILSEHGATIIRNFLVPGGPR